MIIGAGQFRPRLHVIACPGFMAAGTAGAAVPASGPAMPVMGAMALTAGAIQAIRGPRNEALEDRTVQVIQQIESAMAANAATYFSGPQTQYQRHQALEANEALWVQLVEVLSNPKLYEWGRNGLRDRSPGGQYDLYTPYVSAIRDSRPDTGLVARLENLAARIGISAWALYAGTAALALMAWKKWR